MQRKHFLLLAVLLLSAPLVAQQGFFAQWEQRASATQAKQPAWPPPLITTYVGLIQVARTDFIRQTAPNLSTTWNLDGGKGLNLIPAANTEVDINLPGYFVHTSPTVANGAGDMSFVLKYRAFTGGAEHGNYDVSAYLSATIPTGSYKNGSADATVSPNLGFGKGYRRVDVQSTFGASLPVMDTVKLGRSVAWNTAGQVHVAKCFWPEFEINSTWFTGGANDGKNMTFATPGLLIGQKIHPGDSHSRLAITLGAGEQIAITHFHTYNHEIAITSRLVF
ncbi:MAG: transporter [Terracidiphilus sp.]